MGDEGHHDHRHGHSHTAVDHDLYTHRRAVRAIWVSAVGLGLTAVFQFIIVALCGSAALFADALHNIGDVAGTASLWIAFSLSRRAANDEFSYGWRRAEDLAGLMIVLAILGSAGLAGYDSLRALLGEQHAVQNHGWAFAAALVGVAGNEAVAHYKIKVGREIDSVPLVADGQHARTDGLASAAAAVGIVGAWLGFTAADPIAGLVITAAILWILREVGRDVFRRAMDAVEPTVVPRIREVAGGVDGVLGVHDVRARYLGRSLAVQLHAEADPELSLRAAHAIGEDIRHRLVHAFPHIHTVDVHLDPAGEATDAHAVTHHHFGTRERSDVQPPEL
ncbi:MAG TPA: cation diffusion facilitator family transporter [Egibacteraceae bacterium]|nr:cation diffusion facilitator family transporter [Egibacteraceae bacterium]